MSVMHSGDRNYKNDAQTKDEKAKREAVRRFVFAPQASFVIGRYGRKRGRVYAGESGGQFI